MTKSDAAGVLLSLAFLACFLGLVEANVRALVNPRAKWARVFVVAECLVLGGGLLGLIGYCVWVLLS